VFGNEDSALRDSFLYDLLAPPVFTRPEVFSEQRVSDVLLSGYHARIAAWRHEQSVERTRRLRPDLSQESETN